MASHAMQTELQFLYDSSRFGIFESVDLPEAAEATDSDHVVFATELEQVHSYFFPLALTQHLLLICGLACQF